MQPMKNVHTTSCTYFVGILVLLTLFEGSKVEGHGRLIDPPSRATMWRYGFDTKADYDDNAGYCGGKSQLWSRFKGKCGVCGDPWEPRPRAHERGGRYYDGTPVKYYDEGDVITVSMGITANHRGWVEFRLCPYDWPDDEDVEYDDDGNFLEVSQRCLDKYLLEMADGSGTRFDLPEPFRVGEYSVEIRLPSGVSCDKCLFQWKWNVANSWGTDPDGTSCVGCGDQEQFYACADIVIESDGWDEPEYPSFDPETEPPPRPSLPPPPPPKKPDQEPRYPQTFPPAVTTGYPITFDPWGIPDEGERDYPDFYPDERGGKPDPDEGNRGVTPRGRQPETVAPRRPTTPTPRPRTTTTTTKKPVTRAPTTTRAVPPRPTKKSKTKPRKDKENRSRGKTPKSDDPEWGQPVPSFWRWLLLNHPVRQSKTTPGTTTPRSVVTEPGEGLTKTTRSWWQKLVSLAEETVWEPKDETLEQMQQQRQQQQQQQQQQDQQQNQPLSRVKKSSTTVTQPTTTTTTTPTTTTTTTTTTTMPPTTTTPTTTTTTKPTTTTTQITTTPPEASVKDQEKSRIDKTMSDIRSIADKLNKMSQTVPWWLHKVQRKGPAFLFNSWDNFENPNEIPHEQHEDVPDYEASEVRLAENRLAKSHIFEHGLEENKKGKNKLVKGGEEFSIVPVPYLGSIELSDFKRRERLKAQDGASQTTTNQITADVSRDEVNVSVSNKDGPYNERSMLSAISVSSANEKDEEESRDISKTSKQTSKTVDGSSSLEAGNEDKFISPTRKEDGLPRWVQAATEAAMKGSAVKGLGGDVVDEETNEFENDAADTSLPFSGNNMFSHSNQGRTEPQDAVANIPRTPNGNAMPPRRRVIRPVPRNLPIVLPQRRLERKEPQIALTHFPHTPMGNAVMLPKRRPVLPQNTPIFPPRNAMYNDQRGRLPLPEDHAVLPQNYPVMPPPNRFPILPVSGGRSGYLPIPHGTSFYANHMVCTPAGDWVQYREMWRWCQFHCSGGYCPPTHCMCA